MSVLDISNDPSVMDLFGSSSSGGWADYSDTTTYTEGSPLALAANTDTRLVINANNKITSQMPPDVTAFYDEENDVITGRNGDGIGITVEFKAKPSSAGTTQLEVWFDIGGAVGELYRRIVTFPKGNGVERSVNFTVLGYTLGTWEANGAQIFVRANGTCDVYTPRVLITRTHKAR